mmetsp:Transcript_93375/g.166072  ORF Transcript_93375/g.166072 Transcript_93375/m.166072 type:complete len:304 (+) Transcript_93375:47-958(+)
MGCTSSGAMPGEPTGGQDVAPNQQNRQQALVRAQQAVAAQQGAQNQPGHGGSLTTAPLLRSMVNLTRDSCAVEKDASGKWFLEFTFASRAAGIARASFLVKGGHKVDSDGLEQVLATSSEEARFQAGQKQQKRLFLSSDLAASLQSWEEKEETSHVMLDLIVDGQHPKTVTAQRNFMKLSVSEEGDAEIHLEKQLVQCGKLVRDLHALYGTMPNPRASSGSGEKLGDADGGDCVICLSNPREVAILHCRHVCLCLSCAQITSSTWSFQCPVCRGRVAAMVGLKDLEGEETQTSSGSQSLIASM